MKKTLGEIAEIIQGTVVGDPDVIITGVSGVKEAKVGDLAFVANTKYLGLMDTTKASGIIVSREIKNAPKPVIQTDNPDLAFAKIVGLLAPNEIIHPEGIHPTAIIGKNVKIGKKVAIQPYVVIEHDALIGDGSVLSAGVYIGHHTRIGKDTLIYPHVTIRERVQIGDRVIIHSGTVIGSDGFGFSFVKGVHHKIPQIGTVHIEDDVEIGANVTIDRARFDKTHIKRGTKIDNLVQIAHNVVIGENSIVVAQTGISGSAVIGNNVALAGQSGVIGHVTIGDNVIVAGRSGVTKSLKENAFVSGFPAQPHDKENRIKACIRRLPKYFKDIVDISKRLAKLEESRKGSIKDDTAEDDN